MTTADILHAEIVRVAQNLPGRLGVALKFLPDGPSVRFQAEQVFPSASVIKILVLAAVFHQAYAGEIDLRARLTLNPDVRVEGSGVLCHLSDGWK